MNFQSIHNHKTSPAWATYLKDYHVPTAAGVCDRVSCSWWRYQGQVDQRRRPGACGEFTSRLDTPRQHIR